MISSLILSVPFSKTSIRCPSRDIARAFGYMLKEIALLPRSAWRTVELDVHQPAVSEARWL
jgi:hypothetical protein